MTIAIETCSRTSRTRRANTAPSPSCTRGRCASVHLDKSTSRKSVAGDKGFECGCEPGFKLIDGTWCRGVNVPENEEATGIFVTPSELLIRTFYNVSAENTRVLDTTTDKTGTMGMPMAVDHRHRRVCSLKSVYNPSSKERSNEMQCIKIGTDLKFGERTLLEPQFELSGVNGISYDWVGNNWYFMDFVYKRIFACDGNEMKRCITIRKEGIEKPEALYVDSSVGFIFYAEKSVKRSGLWRLDMDGSNPLYMTQGGVLEPEVLAGDPASKTIYWVDTYLQYLMAKDYFNRFEKRVVFAGRLKGISSISLIDRTIYAVDINERMLEIDTMSDTNQELKVHDLAADMLKTEAMLIFHRQQQPDVRVKIIPLFAILSAIFVWMGDNILIWRFFGGFGVKIGWPENSQLVIHRTISPMPDQKRRMRTLLPGGV
uniref:EGF-like domain-containing protein n=1 Tax=Steinernema glaseri TaxID=37863 RepID=A0A1I7YEH0_9BILA